MDIDQFGSNLSSISFVDVGAAISSELARELASVLLFVFVFYTREGFNPSTCLERIKSIMEENRMPFFFLMVSFFFFIGVDEGDRNGGVISGYIRCFDDCIYCFNHPYTLV